MRILRRERFEHASTQRVRLEVRDAPLDLAFMPRSSWSRGKEREAVVPAELDDLRVEHRIVPIGLSHRRLRVVEHDRPRHAAEDAEGVLQRPHE
jgi:hypothetical protein